MPSFTGLGATSDSILIEDVYDAGGTADIKEDNIAWTRMASSRSATEKVMVQKQAPPQMNVVIY